MRRSKETNTLLITTSRDALFLDRWQDDANEATPKAVELSPLTVHGMRHTFATIALQSGIPVTVVSKYLGHSSVTTTLNTYSHVLRGAQRDLANTVADAIRRGAV